MEGDGCRLPGAPRRDAGLLLQPYWIPGGAVERRKSQRRNIQVDIEIAHPRAGHCCGYAENISRDGVSIKLTKGVLPSGQRSVILNFRVWTGSETLYRKLYARIVRDSTEQIAMEFAETDFVAEAIVQDLIYYQNYERRNESRRDIGRLAEFDSPAAVFRVDQ
jgi:hypothetical protein